MRVLVACECTGVVRDAFRALGHDAWSCDLRPSEVGGPHLEMDAIKAASIYEWDLMIAHPPCTYLCSSGLHWNHKVPGREAKTEEAVEFVRQLMNAPIPRICIENPMGRIGTAIRKADQYIQPYQFGHDASKKTGLWLEGLPHLEAHPADYVEPRWVDGKPRWGNQTDSGQNRLGPSEDRWLERATTYDNIAWAMARQWGGVAYEAKQTHTETEEA